MSGGCAWKPIKAEELIVSMPKEEMRQVNDVGLRVLPTTSFAESNPSKYLISCQYSFLVSSFYAFSVKRVRMSIVKYFNQVAEL